MEPCSRINQALDRLPPQADIAVKAKQRSIVNEYGLQTLQVFLGSQYVNDFTFLGRVFRVLAQSDATFRATARDVGQFQTRNNAGQMVPLGSVMQVNPTFGPTRVTRYNGFPSADINGAANPGFSSIPPSIYWAIVTMTTVGYGDIAPRTNLGQFFASALMILGYGVIAVPTGIVSAEMINMKGREHISNQRCPHCMKEGHDSDAIFCKFCGGKLNE